MSSNIIYLNGISQMKPTIKVENLKPMPNLFMNLLNQYKKKQDDIRRKKINFLFKEGYNYFYDLLETPEIQDVDLPYFIYEDRRKKLAYEYASKALLDVIKAKKLINVINSASKN